MRFEGTYSGEAVFVRSVISPIVEKHYPSKANREKMSLYDLLAFAVMAHSTPRAFIRGLIGSS